MRHVSVSFRFLDDACALMPLSVSSAVVVYQ